MGDTGSQSLGAIAVTSILLKQEIVLAVAGGLFVIETLSVMIQVTYFRLSKGKEYFWWPTSSSLWKKGLSEQKIVIRFWILVSFLFVSLSLLKIR